MKPIHALAVAAALALGVVLGVAAVTKTSTLGASARHTSAKTITARAHKLNSFEASLKKALAAKPPKLPKVPAPGAATPVAAPSGGYATTMSAAAPQVVYQRPAPIIIHKHSHHGDDGSEPEGGSSSFASHATGGGEGGGGND